MTILHYNILNGFEGREDRIAAFIEWLGSAAPDVVSLNEYRLGDERLRDGLAGLGYVHAVINTASPSGNRCAVFSRLPFAEREEADDFRFLRVRLGGLDFASYHASPEGAAVVLAELERLAPRLEGRRNLVLAGDFNSLSSADRDRFGYERPGQRIRDRYLRAGAVSYDLIEGLVGHGLRDLNAGPAEATVPTAIPRPKESGLTARLDYAFGRLETFDASSRVLREPVFDRLSDHYPVLVTLVPHAR